MRATMFFQLYLAALLLLGSSSNAFIQTGARCPHLPISTLFLHPNQADELASMANEHLKKESEEMEHSSMPTVSTAMPMKRRRLPVVSWCMDRLGRSAAKTHHHNRSILRP